jgi:hypothetical protein
MVNEANPNRAKNPRVRTWGGSADRPVVATAPKPYAPTAGVSAQQNARNADAYALTVPYVSKVKQEADRQAEADKITAEILGGQSYGGTGTRTTAFQNALGMLGGGGTGSGKSTGPKASDRLARDEFNYKKEQDAIAAKAKQDALQEMIKQITSGSYAGNTDDLLAEIDAMNTTGSTNINDIYNTAIENIGAGYNTAQGLLDTGYGGLEQYLTQNQNNPYAGLTAQMPAVTNPMQNYLDAYGVSAPDVAGQIQAEQLAGQQGAGAFQSLIDILGANAKSNDLSRLAESKMARNMATTGLGAQRASYTSQAGNARQQALADLAQRINQARFEQKQAAGGRKQSIIDAIIAAGGSIPEPPPPPIDFSGIDFSGLNNMFGPGFGSGR